MRYPALVAITLALLLAPAASRAQEPHWVFEVPYELQSINQHVSSVDVMCQVFDHPAETLGAWQQGGIGIAVSEIQLDANGNGSGVATLEVDSPNPGDATHYACMLRLDTEPAGPSAPLLRHQPRSGTAFDGLASGALP